MRFRGVCRASALLAALLAASLGCAKAPSDGQLSEQIREKFKQDSGLQDKTISVQISKGVVTLAGAVDNDAERTAAARYASTTAGIKEVVNNLVVAAGTPSEPMAEKAMPATSAAAAPAQPPERKPRSSDSAMARLQQGSAQPQHAHDPPPRPVGGDDSSVEQPSNAVANSTNASEAAPAEQIAGNEPASTKPASEMTDAAPDVPSSSSPPSVPRMMTLESGTTLAIRLVDAIDSEAAQKGQTFRATLDSPLSVEWDVAIPAGYNVEGHIVEVKSAGKFAGQSELVVTLDKILVGEKSYDIQTDDYRRKGKSQSTKTAEKVGAGAAIGAIIGGIVGGGKGAGIGAAAGGGVGGATQAAGKGQPVRLESETVLNFTLQAPVTVAQVEENPEGRRQKLRPAK
ncbi:MAG: BON domain-containing protein [Terriglobales bacterium]